MTGEKKIKDYLKIEEYITGKGEGGSLRVAVCDHSIFVYWLKWSFSGSINISTSVHQSLSRAKPKYTLFSAMINQTSFNLELIELINFI